MTALQRIKYNFITNVMLNSLAASGIIMYCKFA